MGRILFITGTSTGVGKTALTGLLLKHLLQRGIRARGLKPFCSGERTDANLLWELQRDHLDIDEINPFYFEKPISPWTAARLEGRAVSSEQVLTVLDKHQKHCDILLVEGAGGLLSPLGEFFNIADLVQRTGGEALVVAPNALGVLNSVLLVLEALGTRGVEQIKIVLTETGPVDSSHSTNLTDLKALVAPRKVHNLPFIENYRPSASCIREAAPGIAGILQELI